MGNLLQLKTNYQPTHKFSDDAILALGALLARSYAKDMLDRDFAPADIKDFFAASLDKSFELIQQAEQTAKQAAAKFVENHNVEVTTKGNEITYRNSYCWVNYNHEEQSFNGGDLTDHNNEPRFYSKTRRSHKKAALALKNSFTTETTMYDAMKILQANSIDCRSWCSMD